MMTFRRFSALALAGVLVVSGGLLQGCGDPIGLSPTVYPDKDRGDNSPRLATPKEDNILGSLFGPGDRNKGDGTGVGVNVYLWRASLDTVSFMPIANADPFGGTILTDWYQIPEAPAARFKLNVFILDKVLRSDGVRVTIFKQIKDGQGQWVDTKVDAKMGTDLENAILTRARQMRIAATVAP